MTYSGLCSVLLISHPVQYKYWPCVGLYGGGRPGGLIGRTLAREDYSYRS